MTQEAGESYSNIVKDIRTMKDQTIAATTIGELPVIPTL